MEFHFLCIPGWGATGVQETSTDKLKETVVPIVESSICKGRMKQPEDVNEDLIVCVGDTAEGPCKVMSHQRKGFKKDHLVIGSAKGAQNLTFSFVFLLQGG